MSLAYVDRKDFDNVPYNKVFSNDISADEYLLNYLTKKTHKYIPLINLINLKTNQFKNYFIFLGFEFWRVYMYDQKLKLNNINPDLKLSLPVSLMKLFSDKCKLMDYFQAKSLPVLKTVCLKSKSITKPKIESIIKQIGPIFIKPSAGMHANLCVKSNNTSVWESVNKIKDKYGGLIIQPYIPTFATKINPEIRTYWIGHELYMCYYTTGNGDVIKYRKKAPAALYKIGKKIINQIESDFNMKFIYCRLDFGRLKPRSRIFFLNELELSPGLLSNYWSKYTKGYIEGIGNQIIKHIAN